MATKTASPNSAVEIFRQRRLLILGTILLLGLAYVAVPQLGFFNANWSVLLGSDWRNFSLAVGCLLLSFVAAASIYQLLTPKKLRFGQTYLVQVAGAFAGKVLPAGLGSISVNYLYLRKRGCNKPVAATVVAVNNLLGFVGHGLWLLVIALLFTTQLKAIGQQKLPSGWPVLGLVVGLCLGLSVIIFLRHRLRKLFSGVLMQLRKYRGKPGTLVAALASSMLLTACNIAIVWLSARAIDVPLGVVAAAVALTAGLLAQTATPTPGGLGGVEAGLVAGLTLGGLSLQHAVAVTILFRFVTFWLPLVLGASAFLVVMRKKYI